MKQTPEQPAAAESHIYIYDHKGFQPFLCAPLRSLKGSARQQVIVQPTDKLVKRFAKGNNVEQVQKPCRGLHHS